MDLLKKIQWNVTDQYLHDITVGARHLTKEEIHILHSPIRLETSKLILNLRPSKYAQAIPVSFDIGPEVTPLGILGAIHTYYSSRHNGMENLLFVHGFLQQPDGSLTPEMEPEFRVVLPRVKMTETTQLLIAPPASPPTSPPISPQRRLGLTLQAYSEKSVVVRGNLDYYEEITSAMERLGGKYNAYLKGGPGWIFPTFKKGPIENYFTTGQYHHRPIPKRSTDAPSIQMINRFMVENGLKRGAIWAGFQIRDFIMKSTDPLIVSRVNVFSIYHQYYGIEVIVGLHTGKIPDPKEYYEWCEPTDNTHMSVYALFGPRDQLEKEREDILIDWPTERYATKITTLTNGDGEILLVSHLNVELNE